MAETVTKTTAPRKPSTRVRTPGRGSTTKTAAKTAPVATEAPETATEEAPELSSDTMIALLPHPEGDTKNYSRWIAPAGSGCQGTFYTPLGTPSVKVILENIA